MAAFSQEHAEPIDWRLNFRPRYEYVDQSSKSLDANAVTLRTLAGITVRPTQSLVGRIENFRWDGDQNAVSGARLNYTVEYARQRPFSDGAPKAFVRMTMKPSAVTMVATDFRPRL